MNGIDFIVRDLTQSTLSLHNIFKPMKAEPPKSTSERVYEVLLRNPATKAEMKEVLGFDENQMHGALRRLKKNGLVYISQPRGKHVPQPVYAAVPNPPKREHPIIEAIRKHGPMTTRKYAAMTGRHLTSVRAGFNKLVVAGELVQIGFENHAAIHAITSLVRNGDIKPPKR